MGACRIADYAVAGIAHVFRFDDDFATTSLATVDALVQIFNNDIEFTTGSMMIFSQAGDVYVKDNDFVNDSPGSIFIDVLDSLGQCTAQNNEPDAANEGYSNVCDATF